LRSHLQLQIIAFAEGRQKGNTIFPSRLKKAPAYRIEICCSEIEVILIYFGDAATKTALLLIETLKPFAASLSALRSGSLSPTTAGSYTAFGEVLTSESHVCWRRIYPFPNKVCSFGVPLLDATGVSSTLADGKRMFQVSDLVCSQAHPLVLGNSSKSAAALPPSAGRRSVKTA
jgi:hypothetical protein